MGSQDIILSRLVAGGLEGEALAREYRLRTGLPVPPSAIGETIVAKALPPAKERTREVLRLLAAVTELSAREVSDAVPLAACETHHALSILGKRGHVRRVDRGLYAITDAGRTAL